MKKDSAQQKTHQQILKQPSNTLNATDIKNNNSDNNNGYSDKVESSTKQRTKSFDNTSEGTKSASTKFKYKYANPHQGVLSYNRQLENESVKKDDKVTSPHQRTNFDKKSNINSYKRYAPTQTEVEKMKVSMTPQSTKTLTIMMNMTKQMPQDKSGAQKRALNATSIHRGRSRMKMNCNLEISMKNMTLVISKYSQTVLTKARVHIFQLSLRSY